MENKEQVQLAPIDNGVKSKKSKRNKILAFTLIPLAIIIAFTGGYFSRYIFHSKSANTAVDVISIMEKVGYIYDPITGEKREITQEDVADALVYGLLDRYSAYYTEEEYGVVNSSAKGRFSGIGITLLNTGEIFSVTLNSPAEISGLKVGDKMISVSAVGGEKILYATNGGNDFDEFIANTPTNRKIVFEIDRSGEQKSFEVVKKAYVASYVLYHDNEKTLNFRENNERKLQPVPIDGGMNELPKDTAYIKLVAFNGDASEQIGQAIAYMKDRQKTKLILDLRDNGGGYTNILEEIASYFIYNNGKSSSLIAYAEGKSGSQSFYADGNNFNKDIVSISVIANQNTASASECLLGAMLHYKDCFDQSKLVIEINNEGVARTYGKGIMQTTYELIGGGALKLTTAKIFLPDKTTSIHDVGFRANPENAVENDNAISRAIEVLG